MYKDQIISDIQQIPSRDQTLARENKGPECNTFETEA